MRAATCYVCQSCAHIESRWIGRCVKCSEWNSFIEEKADPHTPGLRGGRPMPVLLRDVEAADIPRECSGIEPFDRVLGGGVVPGSLVLLGGDPGMGKSTLLLQVLNGLKCSSLYVSGEESAVQTAARAKRLGIKHPSLYIVSETSLENIQASAQELQPDVMVLDSVQTLTTSALDSSAGSASQVKEVAGRMGYFAKPRDLCVILVGHANKDNDFAGPKTLEHIVDVVLWLEGDADSPARWLKATKNRFGPTHELGEFRMGERGMVSAKRAEQGGESQAPRAPTVKA